MLKTIISEHWSVVVSNVVDMPVFFSCNSKPFSPAVHVPSMIQQQMLFTQNVMLKSFLTAVSTCKRVHHVTLLTVYFIACTFVLVAAVATFSVLYLLPSTRALFDKVYNLSLALVMRILVV